MKNKDIPFNWPHMTGKELYYIAEAHFNGCLAGDGPFTKRCHGWLEERAGCSKALLTHSCTAALEMAALLLDIQPGDEIIMPICLYCECFCAQGWRACIRGYPRGYLEH
jgi:dTDP-4-amino-4,6-dideoxygalactose transaminase